MFRKNSHTPLETEVAGLVFPNPLGIPYVLKKYRFKCFHPVPKVGFLTMTPPSDNVLPWIKGLRSSLPESAILAVDVKSDIVRTFSLIYDFADLIIIDPDSDSGIDATDMGDTVDLLEELVSLRLCYEHYTPVFLRLWHGITLEELRILLDACQLDGLDGVVVPSLPLVSQVRELTLGRLPVICMVSQAEDALPALREGAALLELRPGFKGVNRTLKILEKQ